MKQSVFFLAALMIALSLPFSTSAAEAEDLAPGLSVTSSVGGGNALLDANRSTSITADSGVTFTLTSEKPMHQIYLVWDTPPNTWDLLYGAVGSEKRQPYGLNKFIHEYIKLDTPLTELTIELHGKDNILCDIYAFGAGDAPAWVQQWEPPYEDADMLLLPVHADDELLYFGGTMPLYAGELGKKVQVAYMTNHWSEAYRTHELLNGLWTVGIRAYPIIPEFVDVLVNDIDEAREQYDDDAFTEYQVELIRRFKPEVVIGHDLNGEYGHGAHCLAAETLTIAVEASTDEMQYRDSYKKYGAWDVEKTYLHLYPENEIVMDWSTPLAHFGGKTALDMAKEGFAAHASQQTYFEVEDSGPYDCRRFGLYRSTVGPDVLGNDFFENVGTALPEPEEPVPEDELATSSEPMEPAVYTPEEPKPIQPEGDPRTPAPLLYLGIAGGVCILLAVLLQLKKDY